MAADPDWSRTDDLYAVLGVAPDATDRQIREAYRLVARESHPDRRPGDRAAEERFKRVTAAYEVLADPNRRAAYDRQRRHGGAAGGRRPPGRTGPINIPVQHVRGDYLRDARDSRRSTRVRTAGRPRPGRNLQVDATVPLARAVSGGTITVPVPSAGAGSASHVDVRLPAGVRHGQTLRVPGAGAPSADGGAPGDLEVTVRVQPHPHFERQGDDLTVTVPVTYPQAVLGAEVQVPLLDGERLAVRVPPGTPSGRVLRVRGRGVPAADLRRRGDLLVTVEVAVPGRIGDVERRAIEALAEAMEAERSDAPE